MLKYSHSPTKTLPSMAHGQPSQLLSLYPPRSHRHALRIIIYTARFSISLTKMKIQILRLLLLGLASSTRGNSFNYPEEITAINDNSDLSTDPVFIVSESQQFLWITSELVVLLALWQNGTPGAREVLGGKSDFLPHLHYPVINSKRLSSQCCRWIFSWNGHPAENLKNGNIFLQLYNISYSSADPLATSRHFNITDPAAASSTSTSVHETSSSPSSSPASRPHYHSFYYFNYLYIFDLCRCISIDKSHIVAIKQYLAPRSSRRPQWKEDKGRDWYLCWSGNQRHDFCRCGSIYNLSTKRQTICSPRRQWKDIINIRSATVSFVSIAVPWFTLSAS